MNRICLFAAGAAWLALCGCTLLKPQPAGDVLERVEPDLGGEYYLYKPTNYSESRRWPLLVLCHASPWQSPKSVIADWATVAEEKRAAADLLHRLEGCIGCNCNAAGSCETLGTPATPTTVCTVVCMLVGQLPAAIAETTQNPGPRTEASRAILSVGDDRATPPLGTFASAIIVASSFASAAPT